MLKDLKEIHELFQELLNNEQISNFEKYLNLMNAYNKHTNITSIKTEEDVWIKHIYDSVWFTNEVKEFDTNSRVLDVGSGAGFPGLPIKIVKPKIQLSLLEASFKKTTFLNTVKETLKIPFEVINQRAEEYAKTHQCYYDVITFRAVGELTSLLEICIPMLKTNGIIIALKSQNYQNEIESAKNALKTLKSIVLTTHIKELPFEKGFRSVIIIKKIEHVSGFPRTFSMIKNKGL
jgi:16S rRNA (guanine527-N7)-methyltransferase